MTVVAVLSATGANGTSGDAATLELSCQSGQLEAFINWHSQLGNEDPLVTHQFGNESSQSNRWRISTESTSTFYYENASLEVLDRYNSRSDMIEAFIQKLMTVDTFFAQVTPGNGSPMTALFNLTGIETAGQEVLDACPTNN